MKIKRQAIAFIAFLMAALIIAGACKKKDDDSDDDNNNTNPPAGTTWNLNVQVDLGGVFTVLAAATITVNGSNFSAAITTSQIGGAAEVHNIIINGTVNSGTYTVTNQTFNISVGGGTENVTITSGTHTTTSTALTGSGNISVIPAGMSTPEAGTYTATGAL